MDVALALAGLALTAIILSEVFSDLFRPSGTGALSDWLGRRLFTLLKRWPRRLPLAGPVVLVTVIGTWVAGLVIGFSLMYYLAYPADFRTSTGSIPAGSSRFSSVLYFSFETLVTLGYGDLVPQTPLMRTVSTIEALVGFGLLTASVSSIVLLYPALSRMRLLARGMSHLVAAEKQLGLLVVDSGSDVVLNSLARDVTHARIDLMHFPIVYYFAVSDRPAAIATWMRDLTRLAIDGRSPGRPEHVRLASAALDAALHDFADILERRFLHTHSQDRQQIFESFARDHLVSR
jgi:ion channel